MFTITGIVGPTGKYLVSGMAVTSKVDAVLKLAFENNTAGTNLALCAGTPAEFNAGTAAIQLSDSGGPGFKFLTIVDVGTIANMVIYVLRRVGTANSEFTLTVD